MCFFHVGVCLKTWEVNILYKTPVKKPLKGAESLDCLQRQLDHVTYLMSRFKLIGCSLHETGKVEGSLKRRVIRTKIDMEKFDDYFKPDQF